MRIDDEDKERLMYVFGMVLVFIFAMYTVTQMASCEYRRPLPNGAEGHE